MCTKPQMSALFFSILLPERRSPDFMYLIYEEIQLGARKLEFIRARLLIFEKRRLSKAGPRNLFSLSNCWGVEPAPQIRSPVP